MATSWEIDYKKAVTDARLHQLDALEDEDMVAEAVETAQLKEAEARANGTSQERLERIKVSAYQDAQGIMRQVGVIRRLMSSDITDDFDPSCESNPTELK